MPPRADYHMHSQFSCDARTTMADMCRACVEARMEEIAFTDHLDVHPLDDCPGFYRPDAYFAELARCREMFGVRLTIRAGVEVGDSHRFADEIAKVVRAYPYDFALGSVHWIGDEAPFGPAFFQKHEADWAWTGYFREMTGLAGAEDYDVVAHFDLIKREGTEFYGAMRHDDYTDVVREILKGLIGRGKGIEINCAGWRKSSNEPSPGLAILKWYAELGGEILTIGSDAHRPMHVALRWDDALALAREAGLRWLTTFEGRKPTQHPL